MNYWFLYIITTGVIYGTPYLGNADEWTNIPDGCAVLGPFDSITASTTVIDAYIHANYYLVQSGSLVEKSNILDLQLIDAKNSKINEVTNAYLAELNSTFASSATGTSLAYDFSLTSQTLWKELSNAIAENYISDTMFPMNITLANGTVVKHTKIQLQQIFGEITTRKLSLYGKFQGMKGANGSIMSAKTKNDVSVISW